MNKSTQTNLGQYNKATAAAVSQALVQLVAAFVRFPPELEQAIGIVLTSVLVYIVPNRGGDVPADKQVPARGMPLIAHSPVPVAATALALSLLLSGCAALVSGDNLGDRFLGQDCGPESRVVRAQALTDGLARAYPGLQLDGVRLSLASMAAAVESDQPIAPAAAEFQDAVVAALAPVMLAARPDGQSIWLHLLRLPPVAAELLHIRRQVADLCRAA